jgi:hypothetical protein
MSPSRATTSLSDRELQRAVRAAVEEVTGPDDRIGEHQTIASLGWGGVLFVDIYTKSRSETFEDLDDALRKIVAVFTGQPVERTTVRWRVSS